MFLINSCRQELYVHVAKHEKDSTISQIQKIPFSKNIRVYYVIFIYSCMFKKVKYYTKFQYIHISTTLFTFYLHILTFF